MTGRMTIGEFEKETFSEEFLAECEEQYEAARQEGLRMTEAKIQRYDIYVYNDGGGEIEPSDDGSFVEYYDHKKIVEELEKRINDLQVKKAEIRGDR